MIDFQGEYIRLTTTDRLASYVGGTAKSIPTGQLGRLDLDDRSALRFQFRQGSATLQIPYSAITEMEFGERIAQRAASAVSEGVTTLGTGALAILYSKKKKHFLTLGFINEEGGSEVVILELAKKIVQTTLALLEDRTGKKVMLQKDSRAQGFGAQMYQDE